MTLAELRDTVFRKADYQEARQAAQKLLSRFGITRPPVDPESIAETLGINVVYVDFDQSADISGLYDFESRTIYVNRGIPANRQTFTIAHELGHAMMHETYVRSQNYRALPRTNVHWGNKPKEEVEADVFAACLLVPKDMLKRYKNIATVEELSQMFAVSQDVVVNQLRYA